MRNSATRALRVPRGPSGGQALTEFALLSPVFFLLIFGIVAAALMVNAQATLDNATREAAREAAICGGSLSAYTDASGSTTQGGDAATCAQAVRAAVYRNLGILQVTSANPAIVVDSPVTQTPDTECLSSAGVTPYHGGAGCAVKVTTTYRYSFLIGYVLGPDAPSITLTSAAQSSGQ